MKEVNEVERDERSTLSCLVEDKPRVLARIVGVLGRRNFNIASLTVGRSEQPGLSRMTIMVEGSSTVVEQARKQLDKLINVIEVIDITDEDIIARELTLIKVKTTSVTRSEIIQIVDIFRANIIDVSPDSLVVEATGDEEKIDSLARLLEGFGIKEMMRTGRIATYRGTDGIFQEEELEPGTA